MPASTMADLQIHVTFSGLSGIVPIGKDHIQLRGNLAAEFDLLAVDIAGFARGGSIYPLTYIARAPRDFFLSTRERALELVVLGPHHRAAPAFTEHKERQNDPIITFTLSNAGKPVVFTRKQWELLSFVRKKTGLGRISLEDLRTKFEKYSTRTGLTKRGFDMLMRDLIPAQSLSESEKEDLAKALSRIFHAFDRNDDGIAEGPDLLTALGMLVSSKGLAFAFRLADANGDGFVSPSEFMVFTRAFLTLVLALNDDIVEFSAEYVTSLIDSTTDSVVRQAFNEADLNRDGLLTWSEFSLWYKNGGHLVMPWVSLLQSRPDSVGHDEQDGDAKAFVDDPNEIVYEFALAPTYGNLVITRTDVDNLENVLLATQLYNKDTELVMEFFCTRAEDQDMLTKEAFDECVRALAPEVASMRREDRNRISYVLNNIFFAFDRSAIRKVRIDEFCTGFSLLCAGSKSTKLQLAFSLFDAEANGSLKPFDFARFLRSVLTVLFALNDAAASLTSFQVYEAIDKTTARATRMMLGNLAQENGGQAVQSISFEDFANFYNTQSGNEMISFVELLDLSKFPFQELELGSKSRRGNKKDAKNDNKVVFSFDMMPVPQRLDVRLKDSTRLRKILDLSGISMLSPEQLHIAVANASSPDRTLSKTDYEQILLDFDLEFGPGEEEEDDPQLVSYFFSSLFYAYDRDGGNEEVDSSEISCALSVLCAGKKSDKLAYGFSAFDSDQDGNLTSEELARFLRSLIMALFVLVQEEEVDQQDPERIWQIVDTTSLHLAADVVHSLGGVNRVSFEQFALWYGKDGYKTASFLELLDMSKWPAVEEDESIDGDDVEQVAEDEVATSGLPVFVFVLTRKHTLEMHEQDIDFVRRLVEASGLNQVGCEELIYAWVSRADEQKSISEEVFLQSLGLIVNNRGNDREFAMVALTGLYEVCDREGLGCDYRDLLGLLFLCGGSKSTKLAHSWNAVSSSKDGDLDRTELFLLMRAFLAALHTFNYAANSNSMDSMHHNIDDAANVLAANIFLASRRKKKDTLSFEEFAEFYSEGGGYQLAPWLELLNLGKFIGAEYDTARPHGQSRHGLQLTNGAKESKESKSAIAANQQDGSRVIFSFKITEDNDSLIVTQKDVMILRTVLDQSRIGSMDSETMVRLLTEQVNEEGLLTEQGFGTFVGTHVLKNEDNAQDDFVAGALYQMFAAFDTHGEGSVDPTAFAVGLSLLGSGSKSSKLSLGWALFSRQEEDDSDVDVGPMTRPMLTSFFVTLLTAISSFAGNCSSDAVISLAASEASDRVFEDVGGEEISFDGFASWYTGQGFEHLSWIELLANTKWRLP